VARADRPEVAAVQREHPADAEALGDRDDRSVHEADAAIGVLPHQLDDARKIVRHQVLHMQLTDDDARQKVGRDPWSRTPRDEIVHLRQHGDRHDDCLTSRLDLKEPPEKHMRAVSSIAERYQSTSIDEDGHAQPCALFRSGGRGSCDQPSYGSIPSINSRSISSGSEEKEPSLWNIPMMEERSGGLILASTY
jgi:hypothetical protein